MGRKNLPRSAFEKLLSLPEAELRSRLRKAADSVHVEYVSTANESEAVPVAPRGLLDLFAIKVYQTPHRTLVERVVKPDKRKGGRNRWKYDREKPGGADERDQAICNRYQASRSAGESHKDSVRAVLEQFKSWDRSTIYRALKKGSKAYLAETLANSPSRRKR